MAVFEDAAARFAESLAIFARTSCSIHQGGKVPPRGGVCLTCEASERGLLIIKDKSVWTEVLAALQSAHQLHKLLQSGFSGHVNKKQAFSSCSSQCSVLCSTAENKTSLLLLQVDRVYVAGQERALIMFLCGRIDLVCQTEAFLRLVSHGAPLRSNGLRRSCSDRDALFRAADKAVH